MDFQDAARLTIPEGEVRNIHDTNSRLLWSAVGYDVDYRGDTEQASYTGKNLFDKDTAPQGGYLATYSALSTGVRAAATNTINYTYIRYVMNVENYVGRTLTLSATASASASNKPALAIGTCDSAGNNRVPKDTQTGTGELTVSYTIASGDQYIYLNFYANQVGTASVGDYADYTDAQLELSASPTSYEPYTGGQPSPSPDYPQEIHTVTGEQALTIRGKNVASPNATMVWKNNSQLQATPIPSGINLSHPTNGPNKQALFSTGINLSPYKGKTVYMRVSFSPSNGGEYRLNRINISGGNRVSMGSTTISGRLVSFEVPQDLGDSEYLGFSLIMTNNVSLSTDFTNLIITIDNSDTTYEAYQSAAYTINLGTTELCKIGGYQDYIYKGSDGWYVHKEIRKRILDGAETWGTSTYQGVGFFYLDTTDGLTSSNSQVVVLSDLFLGQWGGANNTIVFSANSATPRRMMIFTNDIGTTTSEWKTWLGSNNVLTYYALETPTDTKITDSTLVSQLDAVHNRITRYDYQYTISGNLPIIINRTGLT